MNEKPDVADEKFNDPNRIPVTEVSQKICKIIKEVQSTGQRKLVTRNGRAIAAICPLAEVALVEEMNSQECL